MIRNSVTVFLAAYNEEQNIAGAIGSVKKALRGIVNNWEVIIVNDGSTDRTQEICKKLHKTDWKIRVIQHRGNFGMGQAFRTALREATKKYFTIFPGDNDLDWRSLRDTIILTGKADFITGYIRSDIKRGRIRRLFSRLYVKTLNLVFGLKLKYYNGPFVCRTSLLKSINLHSTGMDILSEMTIKVIKGGASYMEIPFSHAGRKHGESKAYSLKNIFQVIVNTGRLWWELR